MEGIRGIGRAIVSLSNKEGAVPFAKALTGRGTEIVSTGGTSKLLRDGGVPVTEIDGVTGFPEMLGGRVRTLHPNVFGGILGRRALESDRAEMKTRGIAAIDLVVVNFYPFARTVARPGVTEAEAIESIDIGGPSLLRAAAKNFESVAVLHDPGQYEEFIERLASPGGLDLEYRRRLAIEAFRYVADYDERILAWFEGTGNGHLPESFHLAGRLRSGLRYGENPHQKASWYDRAGSSHRFEALQGKELSYNNLADSDGAWRLILEFDGPAAAVIKHGNPCGAAVGDDLLTAFRAALASDPVSAFGGIVAINRPVEGPLAAELKPLFLEVILALDFAEEALALLGKKKNLRLVTVAGRPDPGPGREVKVILDGLLVQEGDPPGAGGEGWEVKTKRPPAPDEERDARFAWKVAKHVRSNAIVLAKGGKTIGIGAGQMSRVDSTWIAVEKAKAHGHDPRGSALASDGFFPFPDSVEKAHEAGVTTLVQPGGSIRDDEVIAEADRLGLSMVLTGTRHFRH
ncbi:MAG: bifunctional phosphoribosylaminoimidazolecarboxamide formyltransferase/IMP cyclohydrolase [Candidatus Eisenbacteria bacterium]